MPTRVPANGPAIMYENKNRMKPHCIQCNSRVITKENPNPLPESDIVDNLLLSNGGAHRLQIACIQGNKTP